MFWTNQPAWQGGCPGGVRGPRAEEARSIIRTKFPAKLADGPRSVRWQALILIRSNTLSSDRLQKVFLYHRAALLGLGQFFQFFFDFGCGVSDVLHGF